MVRVMLLILSIVEITLGALGLAGVTMLALSHPAGVTALSLPLLAMTALLLVAGAAIFVRRPWSYYMHIAALLLVGLLLWRNSESFVGPNLAPMLLLVAVIAAITAAFFLPSVRRFFGM